MPSVWRGEWDSVDDENCSCKRDAFWLVWRILQISAHWVTITSRIWWRSFSPWWPGTDTVQRSVRHEDGNSTTLWGTQVYTESNVSMFVFVLAGSGVFCRVCSGCKDCIWWRQREVWPRVDHLVPLTRHLPAAESKQDPAGLVSVSLFCLYVCLLMPDDDSL